MRRPDGNFTPSIQDFDEWVLQHAKRLPALLSMGVSRFLGAFSTTVVASPALAADTIICSTATFNPPTDTCTVLLIGFAAFTVGTSGVSARMRIRQGTATSGTAVGDTGATTQVAANLTELFVMGTDTPGTVNAFQYSLSLIIGSGAAASAVSNVALFAICI